MSQRDGAVRDFSVSGGGGSVSTAILRCDAVLDATYQVIKDGAGTSSGASISTAGLRVAALQVGDANVVLDQHDAGGGSYYLDMTAGAGIRLPVGSESKPSVSLGTSSTGFYGIAGTIIGAVFSGARWWTWTSGGFYSVTSGGPYLDRSAASSINPVFTYGDDNTSGLGRAATGQPCLIASGTEVVRAMRDGASNPVLSVRSILEIVERSSDPAKPTEGEGIIWRSDGSGLGDDGDWMWGATAGGVTNYGTLIDFSAGSVWA